jgi:hypothetical protein
MLPICLGTTFVPRSLTLRSTNVSIDPGNTVERRVSDRGTNVVGYWYLCDI